jgi:hypothetical protein
MTGIHGIISSRIIDKKYLVEILFREAENKRINYASNMLRGSLRFAEEKHNFHTAIFLPKSNCTSVREASVYLLVRIL